MRTATLALSAAIALLSPPFLLPAATALAAQDDTDRLVTIRAELPITSVTLYRGRAAVTREGKTTLGFGVFELRVGPLPEAADLDSVQAKVGAGGRLLDVKTETVVKPSPTSDSPRVREALARVEAAQARVAEVERRMANNMAAQKTIDSIAAKVSDDASKSMGGSLDPEKLRTQLSFIESERERLTAAVLGLKKEAKDAAGELAAAQNALAAAGGAPPIERFALVTVVAPDGGDIPVGVTYLVSNASWAPTYTVRGDPDKGTLALEFDATVMQATGEDWNDVALLLSTSQPTRAANPREIGPAYLEVYQPPVVASRMAPGAPAPMMAAEMADAAPANRPGNPGGEGGARGKRLAAMAANADVGGTGPAVEYRIPRTFTAASDANAERRTRVASIDATPQFTLVARPLVDPDVYLRARFRNETPFLLLPGAARMYLGSDSIGQAALAETPVGGEVELWFGKEPRVTVRRELVAKRGSESGVFSKSKGTERDYRISVTNTLARATDIEVWDRIPVSRDEKIKVETREMSPATATDEKYVRDAKPQGLLKWVLSLPARADGKDAKPATISWRTRTTWPEDIAVIGDVD